MSRILLTLGLVLASAVLSGTSSEPQAGKANDAAALASFSSMPKGQSWTRPAPTTWSSKANVRWEARWGGDPRYMA